MRMVHACQSGHPGGSLGCTEFFVALYFQILKHDKNFNMQGHGEDLFFLSNGHISPVWYATLARSGYFDVNELSTFRKINSRLQGHPATHEHLPGVRVASGSLGQGLSVAIGAAQAKKLNGDEHFVYVLMGDGEQQEGQIWEAAMYAAHHKVDNLIATIDYNGQQIDGPVNEIMSLKNLKGKWEAFGWKVIESNGNDLEEVIETLEKAKSMALLGKPVLNLMTTVMGNGVDFMMGSHKWHGVAPNDAELEKALAQLEETLGDFGPLTPEGGTQRTPGSMRTLSEPDIAEKIEVTPGYRVARNSPFGGQGAEKKDTRSGFGSGLHELGKANADVVALCADLTGSLKMDAFKKEFPERFFQVGVAEANMMGIAAGLSIGGKIPFTGTFANFSTGRVYDQIRQSIAYSGKNVKICASHAGLTLGEDGATHQILEDVGMMKMLPGMTVIVPCDYNQTKAATIALGQHVGPAYLRFGRPAWPVFTATDQKFTIGKADVMVEGNDVTIFANGHMVWIALEAEAKLNEMGISAEVINIHTIKPLDTEAIINSAKKTRCVVTCEEHQMNGGLGDSVGQTLSRHLPTPIEMVAVQDSFGESGKPTDLLKKYGLTPENIVKACEAVIKRRV